MKCKMFLQFSLNIEYISTKVSAFGNKRLTYVRLTFFQIIINLIKYFEFLFDRTDQNLVKTAEKSTLEKVEVYLVTFTLYSSLRGCVTKIQAEIFSLTGSRMDVREPSNSHKNNHPNAWPNLNMLVEQILQGACQEIVSGR